VCFDFLYDFCLKRFSFWENFSEKYHKCTYVFMESTGYSFEILITVEFFWDIFSKKHSNIRFHKNLSSWSSDVPCRRTDRRMDMTELIVAFRNFAKAPKNVTLPLSKWWRNTGGSRRTAPPVPNVGTRWTGVVIFPPRYPLNGLTHGVSVSQNRKLSCPSQESKPGPSSV
jgi:hypothetical protein